MTTRITGQACRRCAGAGEGGLKAGVSASHSGYEKRSLSAPPLSCKMLWHFPAGVFSPWPVHLR